MAEALLRPVHAGALEALGDKAFSPASFWGVGKAAGASERKVSSRPRKSSFAHRLRQPFSLNCQKSVTHRKRTCDSHPTRQEYGLVAEYHSTCQP